MNKQFPPELLAFWKSPNAKRAWVNEPEMVNPSACPNCNGAGFFVGTIALAGPFNSPGSINAVSHFHDGKWWVVNSRQAPCPVCKGAPQSEKPYVDKPSDLMIRRVVKQKQHQHARQEATK